MRISPSHLAIGSTEWNSGDIGFLTVVSMTNGASVVVHESVDTYPFELVTFDGGRIFALEEDFWSGYHAVRVYDATDPTMLAEVARPAFTLPENYGTSSFAVRGRDLFVLSAERTWETPGESPALPTRVEWHRFVEDWSTLAPRSIYGSRVATALVPAEGYVIANVRGTVEDPDASYLGTLVLRLDSAAGLVVASETPDGGVGSTAVDEERGLVLVGGGSLQVLDLGKITTGNARWPDP